MSLLKKEGCQLDLFEKRDKKDNLLKAMDRVNETIRRLDVNLGWALLMLKLKVKSSMLKAY